MYPSTLDNVPMASAPASWPAIPDSCPFSIEQIKRYGVPDSKTYLIREHDRYGEFPHIYAKICSAPDSTTTDDATNNRGIRTNSDAAHKVIVLSDTGCGTRKANATSTEYNSVHQRLLRCASQDQSSIEDGASRPQPQVWDIGTFLEFTINPGGRMPYLVMTTHCHFDHIMGIGKLPSTSTTLSFNRPPTTVLSSSHAKSFITPHAHLQKHSLCSAMNLTAPSYDVGIWAEDMSRVVYSPSSSGISISTPYTIFHTPGHTPDSLAWYDADLRLLCVGDSLYAKETSTTRQAKWGAEPLMPVMFDESGNLKDWWDSLEKVLKFVKEKNSEGGKASKEKTASASTATIGDKASEDDNENDGFVLVEAREALEEASRGRVTSPLPLGPLTSSKSQRQTGFDIPAREQSEYIVIPQQHTRSSRLKPTITPTQVRDRLKHVTDQSPAIPSSSTPEYQEPWMLVQDCNKPLTLDFGNCRGRPWQISLRPQQLKQALVTGSWPPRRRGKCIGETISPPRVRLCAAHTSVNLDAETALTSMRNFMLGVLKDQIPSKHVGDSPTKTDAWLWDYALTDDGTHSGGLPMEEVVEHLDGPFSMIPASMVSDREPQFSVLAPLRIVEEGRKRIPFHELEFKDGRSLKKGPAGVV